RHPHHGPPARQSRSGDGAGRMARRRGQARRQLPQPVRAARAVLRGGGVRAAHQGRRPRHGRAGLAVRAHPPRPCRHPRRPQQGEVAHAGLCVRLPDPHRHVDLARAPRRDGRAGLRRMRPAAHIEAAIEVLKEVLGRHRPAAAALADWGKNHRFAGSGDRAAIGNLVYDALRRRRSLACRMDADTPRVLALAAAPHALGLSVAAVAAGADGSPHVPSPLSEAELAGLSRELPDDAAPSVRGDFPAWLEPSFVQAFGVAAAEEGAALARRAPVDLRVNTLKADREKVLKALARFAPLPTPFSPVGVRLPAPEGPGRQPNVEAEPSHGRGWYEVQDEGSQVAALLSGARPRKQVLDICAGAGGKTLAMAALMGNTGQIYAFDRDKLRLRPIFERLKRAGARNVQVLPPGDNAALEALGPRFDVVLADAPCTGSGVW